MDAFPANLTPADGEQHTGMVCPECRGAMVVKAESWPARLIFQCRVGHSYSAEEMLVGKEEGLEADLWSALHAMEELTAFLLNVDTRIPRLSGPERHRRISRLRQNSEALRALIMTDETIKLDDDSHEQSP
jgi:hypothetical protein